MRTAVWSLAALAGAALALPSGNDGWGNDGWGDDGWGTTSSTKSKASPMTYSNTSSIESPKTSLSSLESTKSSLSSVESTKSSVSSASIISTSSSAVSLSASPKSSSIYTSPITTSASSSVKKSSSLSTSSSSAVSAASTPSKPSSSAASSSKAAVSSVSKAAASSASKASVSAVSSSKSHYTSTLTSYIQSTITVYTTVYTTVSTGTTTKTTGGKTLTSTFLTTGTLTSTVTSTVKVTPTKGASGSASGSGSGVASGSGSSSGSGSGVASGSGSASSSVVSPVTGSATASLSTSTGTSTWTVVKSSSTKTLTSLYTITVTAVPEVTVTEWTTVHTTVCPVTQTWSSGSKTWSSVYETTSLITETSSSAITLSTPSSGETTVSEYTSVLTTVSPTTVTGVNGKSTFTKTYDVTSTITRVVTSTATVTTVPFGTTTFSYTVPTSESTSSIKYPTGYHNSSKPHGTGSVSKAHGTGSASKHPSKFSSLLPISSGAVSKKGSSIPKPSSVVLTSKKASASASASASGYVSKASSMPSKTSSSSSSTCSSAAPTKYAADCVPCEGQPGKDAFCGYTVNDNSYEVTPQTCGHKFYDFTITNQTIAPDGVARYGLVVNGQVPGPAIEANWGDWISVTVHNKMENNGSSIHFHGFRQYYTNEMDGVPSITQCPLAPGDSMTYTFRADNYGSSWYHSHFSLQTYEGVFGPVIIHGPSSVTDYDEEQSIVLSDWSHIPVDQMYDAAQEVGSLPDHGPRTLDTGLINGMNVWGDDGSSSQVGERFVMTVKAGKKYRLRVVSASIQATWKFYVDGHKFTVIANDFVPIKPYTTNILNINIGQRYDLIMEADQKVGNYWMRSDNQDACSTITGGKKIWGIVRYEGAPATLPTSTAYTYTDECVDEPMASLVPVVPLTVGAASQSIDENIFITANGGTPNLYKWTLSGTTFQSQWGDPTLYDIYNNGTIPSYSGSLAIEVPKLGEWVYIIIESVIPVPHPIHLHGHDFFVLAQGSGLYSSATVSLNLVNPPRRDVVLMSGHVVIAYQTDNPGVWLLHCHIGWHNAMGFAMQIIENLDGIKDTVTDSCQLEGTCAAWHTYAKKNGISVIDSGV